MPTVRGWGTPASGLPIPDTEAASSLGQARARTHTRTHALNQQAVELRINVPTSYTPEPRHGGENAWWLQDGALPFFLFLLSLLGCVSLGLMPGNKASEGRAALLGQHPGR